MTRKTILLLLFSLLTFSITYCQNTHKKDTILTIVKAYCLDSLEKDTLIIRLGMRIDIGVVHSYSKLSKSGKYINVQYFNEELHFENGQRVSNLIPDFDCLMLQSDFISKLDNQMQICKNNRNRKDTRWSYEIQTEKFKGDTISDIFDYSLYSFLSDLKCIKPKIDYFCKENITWEQTIMFSELYYYDDWELSHHKPIEYDTVITEKLTCTNGDYKIKTILNTGKIFDYSNSTSIIMEVTMDSSYNIITTLMLWSDSTITYRKEFPGIKYSYCIDYDSNWVATSIIHYRYNKKKNTKAISRVDLRVSTDRYPDFNYVEIKEKNFLGIRKKTTWYNKGINNENPEPDVMYIKLFNKIKQYEYNNIDNEWKLFSIDIYKRGKLVKTKSYYKYGKPNEETIRKYDDSGKLIEICEYSENRLVEKTKIYYKKDKR